MWYIFLFFTHDLFNFLSLCIFAWRILVIDCIVSDVLWWLTFIFQTLILLSIFICRKNQFIFIFSQSVGIIFLQRTLTNFGICTSYHYIIFGFSFSQIILNRLPWIWRTISNLLLNFIINHLFWINLIVHFFINAYMSNSFANLLIIFDFF